MISYNIRFLVVNFIVGYSMTFLYYVEGYVLMTKYVFVAVVLLDIVSFCDFCTQCYRFF